jgi:plastocyanin
MLIRSSLALLITIAACGGSSSDTTDAPKSDPAGDSVMSVTCPATVPLTVDAPDGALRFAFSPASAQISVGDIVKFTTHSEHNVRPDPAALKTDPGLTVERNEAKCLKFTQVGTFGFMCGVHFFKGAITTIITD